MNDNGIQEPLFCQCYRDLPQNGYFGKPTKLRNLQPNMFELLTWNFSQSEQSNYKINYRLPPETKVEKCCHCGCHKSPLNNQNMDCETQKVPTNKIKEKAEGSFNKGKSKDRRETKDNLKMNHKSNFNKNEKYLDNHHPTQEFERNTLKKRQSYNERPKSAVGYGRKQDLKSLKSPNFHDKKKRKVTDEDSFQEEKQINQTQLIKKFKQTTRWIPNSAFTTYFGKPAFENYGRGNTKPTSGGLLYGNYLQSHNVQPHRGMNSPKNQESYAVALMKAKSIGTIHPYPPKVSQKEENKKIKTKQIDDQEHGSIYPVKNNSSHLQIKSPNLYDLQKFGGNGLKKVPKGIYEKMNFEYNQKMDEQQKQEQDFIENYRKAYETESKVQKKSFPKGKKIQ